MRRVRSAARAVLLDAMGTLLRLEPPAPALVRGLRERHGVQVSPARAEQAMRAEMRFYRAHHDEGRDERSLHDLRLRCAGVLGQALGDAAQAIAPAELLDTLLGALRFSAFEDAAPALRALRAQGRRLAVVSNWDVSLASVLAEIGLRSLVDVVVTSAAAGAAKPEPQIFATALRRVDAAATEALHVGDSVEHDVRGAQAAGIDAVLIDRGGTPTGPPGDVPVINSLAELARVAA